MSNDLTSRLPNGEYFKFWEVEPQFDRELHVDCANPNADDANDGSPERPFATINAAAQVATPGTRVLIHAGTYRETVSPRLGGESPERMIFYEAYGDGPAVIKASVVATAFRPSTDWNLFRGVRPDPEHLPVIWETRLNPEDFKGYNPFCAVNILHDRLFIEYDKTDMTTYLNRRGMVFVDGKPLTQVPLYNEMARVPGSYWVEANGQTVHFRLEDDGDPKDHLIELTAREQCFAPEESFLSYIRVKGLVCAHAATGAPVPQRGSISAHRGNHWIIEDCTVDWSNGVGIDIGGECWHHNFDPAHFGGYSVIRRCKILNCGVCGIAGLYAVEMLVEDNLIQGTGWQKMELSWEAGGLKFHNTVNSLIRRNIFTKTLRADHLWLDVGNQNTRITQNLFLDGIEQREAIFIECSRDHVNLIDNNIFWNIEGRFDESQVVHTKGSASWYAMGEEGSIVNGYAIYGEGTDDLYVSHNLIGNCRSAGYFQKTVAFRLAGRGGTARDARIFNNIFYNCREAAIKFPTEKNRAEGNVYAKMPSGYLRVLYPAPTECLDLAAWRKYHGFDLTGCVGDFDVEVDTDKFTLTILPPSPDASPFRRRETTPRTPFAELPTLPEDPVTPNDFTGAPTDGAERIAGPIASLRLGETVSIDPRKL